MKKTPIHLALMTAGVCALSLAGGQGFITQAQAAGAATLTSVPLIPRDDIFGNPERAQGRVSPDGESVSWIAPVDGVLNVWVAPADDPSAARPITSDDYRGIRNHVWAPDSEYVYFLQDKGGNENFQVYASNVEIGEVKSLTPQDEGVRATIQGISRSKADKILVGSNDRNGQVFDLYMVDTTTGEKTLVKENPGYAAWLVDNNLEPRFGVVQVPGGGANVVDFDGNVLYEIPAEDFLTTNAFGFDETNQYMYAVDSRGRDKAALVKISAVDGSVEVIAEPDNADISDVLLHPTTYEPLAYASNYLRNEWTALNPETAADLEFLSANLEGEFSIAGATDDLSTVVVFNGSATAPGVYYLYDREAQTLEKMMSTRPVLDNAPLQPMHPVEITSRDGLTLVSYLTLPAGTDPDGDGRPDAPLPMVLWVHGGPWARDSWGFNAVHQWLANRGYAVLSVNFRGSTGFGKAVRQRGGERVGRQDARRPARRGGLGRGATASPIRDKVAIGAAPTAATPRWSA